MKKVSIFAAAAAVTALAASPVFAKDSMEPRSTTHVQSYKHSMKRMKTSSRMYRHRDAAHLRSASQGWGDRANWNGRGDWNNRGWDNRSSGFWPADVVGGAIGTAGAIATGAVNTAGAIATAPFGGPYRDGYAYRDTYAYGGPEYTYGRPEYAGSYNYDGVAIAYSPNYAARNGFVCQPGTMFRNKAGQMQLCQ